MEIVLEKARQQSSGEGIKEKVKEKGEWEEPHEQKKGQCEKTETYTSPKESSSTPFSGQDLRQYFPAAVQGISEPS